MQNAKDSFYEELRNRLAGLSPERTIYVRGLTRPGCLVDENEILNVSGLPDCFHLTWKSVSITLDAALPLVASVCEIAYSTAGTAENSGMDRGRMLGAMDGELLRALQASPQNVAKRDFTPLAVGGSPILMGTKLWWSDPSFEPVKRDRDRLSRTVLLEVMSFEEDGEL